MPRATPGGSGEPQPALSAAIANTLATRGCLPRWSRRNATGSLPAALARSSIIVSITNAVWVCPTERHHNTGTPVCVVCRLACILAMSYGESVTPSTLVASIPPLTIIGSNAVPAMIDWPTTVCSQPTILPALSTPALTRCTYIGR